MDQFEIEAPMELAESLRPKKKRCFPCEVCVCCPKSVLGWIPKQWHLFHSWTQVWLVAGVFACTGLTIDAVLSVIRAVQQKDRISLFFLQEILTLLFMVPCLFYFASTVEQYDADLHDKRKEAQIARHKLITAFLETVGDMDNMLQNTSETNAGFAERAFETQRRDFIRFLERIQTAFSTKNKESVDRLIEFCLHWFRVFAQCSIDPIGGPMVVIREEELKQCVTSDEICALCLDRLRTAEVKFITKQMQHDSFCIKESCDKLKTAARVGTLLEKAKIKPWTMCTKVADRGMHYLRGVSWLTFGIGRQAIAEDAAGEHEDSFPKVVHFGCGCLVLLSREHLSLIIGFFIGFFLLFLEFIDKETRQKKVLALIGITQFCLGCVLVRFEAVDIIQRLAREARKLEREKQAVHKKQDEMKEFWNKAQQLTDLWLYRSLPCLDLMHEIQTHVQDMNKKEAIESLESINARLENLHGKLGPLEAWFADGEFSPAAKKQFGGALGDVVAEQELHGIESKLGSFINSIDQILVKQHMLAQ